MNYIKKQFKHFINSIAKLLPMRNIILFESIPDYTDNTKAVFDELLKRKVNTKYKFIWIIDQDLSNFKNIQIKNVSFISRYSKKYAYYYSKVARIIISCNFFLPREKQKQRYIYLEHGCALKDTKGKYSLPKNCADADVFALSEYLAADDAENFSFSVSQIKVLGFPRNDDLFHLRPDICQLFETKEDTKLIYWLPTYRQHRSADISHSNIAMPILYNESIAQEVNRHAAQENVLIVVKPHPAQDITRIKSIRLSNLQFIDDAFLQKNHITNYELLGNSDALLTDYSSVYYDYLLTNKPIGLCWDDFEIYQQKEGFRIDVDKIMAGGEKIYTARELCKFISEISAGEDPLLRERVAVCDLIHKYKDDHSASRVTDYIEKHYL